MSIRILLCVVCLMVLWGCQEEQVSPDASKELRALTAEEQELIRSGNQFALDITRQITEQQPGNVFLSPYYINMSLSMALNGAESKTLEQMQQVMQYDVLDRLEVNKVYNELNPFLQSLDNNVQFVSAHAIWHHQDVAVRPLFRDMMIAYYDASVEPLDFFSQKSSSHISKWVEEHTNGKIEPQVPALTQPFAMYMVSATHIKGRWAYSFAKESTAPGTFYLENDEEVIVPMMFTDQASYRYFQDSRKTLIDIPYGNQQYSMTILMPHQEDSLSGLLQNLDAKSFESDLALADTLSYHLYLPKFSINSELPLRNTLSSMGMSDAFSMSANFSGIFSDSLQHPIADLIHQAGIQVDEAGTQTIIPRAAAAVAENASPVVRINRPFVFLIRENHSGAILYTGLFQQPQQQ
jgi:serine protease inhibitor